MTEHTDLLGTIMKVEESEIIRIAWEAVKRRREAAAKRGKQLQINGRMQENGYAIYKDYEWYMEERRQCATAPHDAAW